jgi:hypothetical protein
LGNVRMPFHPVSIRWICVKSNKNVIYL